MAKAAVRRVTKRGYHHGDLERALVDTAVRMIEEAGVDALTLRGVGSRVGVSRTALYRHFDDKQALLARVAAEGFKRFHHALASAAAKADASGGDPLPAMAAAYARFARCHPSHYQTMFSGVLTDGKQDPDLQRSGAAAFDVLVGAIRRGQARGRIRAGDPLQLAEITWALSHGIATLGMTNQLREARAALDAFAVLGWRMLEEGLARK
ncbi:MAG: DNA-binding transcriptional repressor FabR [Acidobacteria bacterium]|nr:DNA-binding transcriptional repressor FabR [Acidobacteriota bacterium]